MAAKEAFIRIFVQDSDGKPKAPGPNDKVKINGGMLGYSATNGFSFKLSKAKLELKIEYAGYAPLHQWFDAVAPAESPKLTPFWPGKGNDPEAANTTRSGYLLACMKKVSTGASRTAGASVMFDFKVTLHPTQEYVAVIGTDYWEGAVSGSAHAHRSNLDFSQHATTYGKHLHASGLLNESSPFTMVDCQRGKVIVWQFEQTHGWQAAYVTTKKTPAPAWPTAASFVSWYNSVARGAIAADQYLGGPDAYKYLSDLGNQRPGTVANFSVFSHAWAGGPILFNTEGSGSLTRSRHDLDMRSSDFQPSNLTGWPELKDAFSAKSTINIWGCFATTLYHEMVYFLGHSKPSDKFRDKWSDPANPKDKTQAEVISTLQRVMDTNCYMKLIARHTGCQTYGGPPGYGSEWKEYSGITSLSPKLKMAIKGEILTVPATLSKTSTVRKTYESGALGSRRFNEFGYMLYSP